jgi:hypothetical protein
LTDITCVAFRGAHTGASTWRPSDDLVLAKHWWLTWLLRYLVYRMTRELISTLLVRCNRKTDGHTS